MKKIFVLFVFVFSLVSCHRSNQYVYIEVLDDYDLFEQPKITISDGDVFEAENDSIAYCIAVDKFFRSIYASKMTEERLMKAGKPMKVRSPKEFVLYTKDSLDISGGEHLSNPAEIIENIDNKYKELTADK
ncbi:hypothetical protein M2451_001850 [Dysgonomonas sp. PFB1-18]|uniref:hypothetical protein n=1 Tax=unclassified Dysgonomonas TaxID=2630389 RepID=UPI0024744B05|nr:MULTISPECIES: hypothetical protein [unclassified Dysgonomonas]MDH6309279.1 hypothetical protein [Dysgonomonas sp. PF1-14]MDH6338841.1 hypothetical protein [Dysgonomonas sp. PF1-16]MDH6380528.1 hypothetical protein [Dysgonomonas sp. PFB1-18]MDH6397669.1 hypothetical protein [Dysgonomonas sp. PF1-23]